MTTGSNIIPLVKQKVTFVEEELTTTHLLKKFRKSIFPAVRQVQNIIDEQSALLEDAIGHLVMFIRTNSAEEAENLLSLDSLHEELKLGHLSVLTRSFTNPLRENIHRVVYAIDMAVDQAKNTVEEMQMLEIPADQALLKMSDQLLAGVLLLRRGLDLVDEDRDAALEAFEALRRSKRDLEKTYRLAIADLFGSEGAADSLAGDGQNRPQVFDRVVELFKRREIYRLLFQIGDHLCLVGANMRGVVEQGA